jgi:hypothetical protein
MLVNRVFSIYQSLARKSPLSFLDNKDNKRRADIMALRLQQELLQAVAQVLKAFRIKSAHDGLDVVSIGSSYNKPGPRLALDTNQQKPIEVPIEKLKSNKVYIEFSSVSPYHKKNIIIDDSSSQCTIQTDSRQSNALANQSTGPSEKVSGQQYDRWLASLQFAMQNEKGLTLDLEGLDNEVPFSITPNRKQPAQNEKGLTLDNKVLCSTTRNRGKKSKNFIAQNIETYSITPNLKQPARYLDFSQKSSFENKCDSSASSQQNVKKKQRPLWS